MGTLFVLDLLCQSFKLFRFRNETVLRIDAISVVGIYTYHFASLHPEQNILVDERIDVTVVQRDGGICRLKASRVRARRQ